LSYTAPRRVERHRASGIVFDHAVLGYIDGDRLLTASGTRNDFHPGWWHWLVVIDAQDAPISPWMPATSWHHRIDVADVTISSRWYSLWYPPVCLAVLTTVTAVLRYQTLKRAHARIGETDSR